VWYPVLDRLAAEHDVIVPDLPGFGASPALPGEDAGPSALARAVAELLRELGIERPHVVGNSLGGWVALELALTGDACAVTAIAPAGLWPAPLAPKPAVARRLAGAALPFLDAIARSERGRRLMLAGTVAHPERVPPAAAARLVRAYATAPGFDAANTAMRSARFERLDELGLPLTFGWPDRDRLVSRPRRLPAHARNVVLHDCGHIPMWDAPDQVVDLILGQTSTTTGSTIGRRRNRS
jgi:pimeloyl-ACP methyl ester carboxylesterase